jgi:hypothetical protein
MPQEGGHRSRSRLSIPIAERESARSLPPGVQATGEEQGSEKARVTGGEYAMGMSLALASHEPRCSRILRITLGFSIAATTRISFLIARTD